MSYIVMSHVPAQVSDLERVVKENHDTMVAVSLEGKAAGAIHHCFLEDNDGTVIIMDEWESEDAFHAFFDGQKDIPQLMASAGVTGPPTTASYRILDTPDRF